MVQSPSWMTNCYNLDKKGGFLLWMYIIGSERYLHHLWFLKGLKYHEVGVRTNFEILWSYLGLKVKWNPSNLKRKIGDCIDFSIHSQSKNDHCQSISHQQLLSIEQLDTGVSLPKNFCKSGIGFRQLLVLELRKMLIFHKSINTLLWQWSPLI